MMAKKARSGLPTPRAPEIATASNRAARPHVASFVRCTFGRPVREQVEGVAPRGGRERLRRAGAQRVPVSLEFPECFGRHRGTVVDTELGERPSPPLPPVRGCPLPQPREARMAAIEVRPQPLPRGETEIGAGAPEGPCLRQLPRRGEDHRLASPRLASLRFRPDEASDPAERGPRHVFLVDQRVVEVEEHRVYRHGASVRWRRASPRPRSRRAAGPPGRRALQGRAARDLGWARDATGGAERDLPSDPMGDRQRRAGRHRGRPGPSGPRAGRVLGARRGQGRPGRGAADRARPHRHHRHT